jgi:hypothetical protein
VKENEERIEKTLWISNNRFEFLSKGGVWFHIDRPKRERSPL